MKTLLLILMKVGEVLGAAAALIFIPIYVGKTTDYIGWWFVSRGYDKDLWDFWLTGILSILILAVASILICAAIYAFPYWIKWNRKILDKIYK